MWVPLAGHCYSRYVRISETCELICQGYLPLEICRVIAEITQTFCLDIMSDHLHGK